MNARNIIIFAPSKHTYIFAVTQKTTVKEFVVLLHEYCVDCPDLVALANCPHFVELATSLFYAD